MKLMIDSLFQVVKYFKFTSVQVEVGSTQSQLVAFSPRNPLEFVTP